MQKLKKEKPALPLTLARRPDAAVSPLLFLYEQ
jgi:hypothetical protein